MTEHYYGKVKSLNQQSHHETLFLRPFNRVLQFLCDTRSQKPSDSCADFAVLYDFPAKEDTEPRPFSEQYARGVANDANCNQLLFLSGYPSAIIIEQIGECFDVEPEFFDKHLGFIGDDGTTCSIHPSHYVLPSQQKVLFQTSITSIGGIHGDAYETIARKRKKFASQIEEYLHKLRMGTDWRPFHSVVRQVEVHDTYRFSLEQCVTILIKREKDENGHWLVIIWSDVGADLSESPRGPWLESMYAPYNTHFRTVNLYTPGIERSHHSHIANRHGGTRGKGLRQSSLLLSKSCGDSVNPKRAVQDPIDALAVFFAFLAESEAQYLDVVKTVLDANMSQTQSGVLDNNPDVRAMLVLSYRALDKRREKNAATIDFLQASNIQATASHVLYDFQYLLGAIDRLKERCSHELNFVMSEAAVKDAQWSKAQSKNNLKFTILATIYVPLSFSCSIFGMQFLAIDSIHRGFIMWSIVTVPLFALSLAFLIWDRERTLH